MKIVTVVGARPQFIKAAAVSKAFQAHGGLEELIVHTGQHFDANMSGVFFDELGIPAPAFHLGIGGGNHGDMTGRMLAAIEQVLLEHRPDWVMVYGDTNSTLAGALAAAKLHIPVAHVEAGLRSFNRRMPEEINRVLTDHAASLLLTPTEVADRNLAREGITGTAVQRVGDVMFDAARMFAAVASGRAAAAKGLGLTNGKYILATLHRAENTHSADRVQALLGLLDHAGSLLPVVLPLHPRTRSVVESSGVDLGAYRHVRIIEPVGYLDMLQLEQAAGLIITDSGGVQKEAYFQRVPCITLREETEWVELVDAGWNRLVGADQERFHNALDDFLSGELPAWEGTLYGDGNAGRKIAACLMAA